MKKYKLDLLLTSLLLVGSSAAVSVFAENDGAPIQETNKPAPESPTNLNNLPSELKAKIMNHAADAQANEKAMNSDYYRERARQDPETVNSLANMSTVSQNFNKAIDEALKTRVLRVPLENGLDTSFFNIFNEKNVQTLEKIAGLRVHLSIHTTQDLDFSKIVDSLKKIGTSHLNLEISDRIISSIDFSLLKSLPKLASLEVWTNVALPTKSVDEIGQVQSLKELEFYNSELPQGGLTKFALLPHLEKLMVLCNRDLTDEDIKAIDQMHSLKALTLQYDTEETKKMLEKAKEKLPKAIHVEVVKAIHSRGY